MSVLQDIKALFHPYYFFNILFSISFIVFKVVTPICESVFVKGTQCELTNVSIIV